MPIASKEHGRITMAPSITAGRFHQPVNLTLDQIFAGAQRGVGWPPWHDCSFFGGWRHPPPMGFFLTFWFFFFIFGSPIVLSVGTTVVFSTVAPPLPTPPVMLLLVRREQTLRVK